MLRGKIHAANDQIVEACNIVSFKEHNKEKWSGPGKVFGTDGKVVLLKFGNMMQRVHSSKVIKFGEEYTPFETTIDITDDAMETLENEETTEETSPQIDGQETNTSEHTNNEISKQNFESNVNTENLKNDEINEHWEKNW